MSCNKEGREIRGEYQLIEMSNSSGISPAFKDVESDRVIKLSANGKLFSSGNLCDFSISSDNDFEGTYNIDDNTMIVDNCEAILNFTIKDKEMIISYPYISIVGLVQAKYIKK